MLSNEAICKSICRADEMGCCVSQTERLVGSTRVAFKHYNTSYWSNTRASLCCIVNAVPSISIRIFEISFMILGVKQYHQHLLEIGGKRYNGEIQEKVYGQCCWRGSLHLLNMSVLLINLCKIQSKKHRFCDEYSYLPANGCECHVSRQ